MELKRKIIHRRDELKMILKLKPIDSQLKTNISHEISFGMEEKIFNEINISSL